MNTKSWYSVILSILILLMTASFSYAGALLSYPKFFATKTNTGLPLVGGKLYTYISGSTTTEKATFKDRSCSTPNTNPVVLNSRGEATIYVTGLYNMILKDPDDNTIWSMDNIEGTPTGNYTFYPNPSETDHGTTGNGSTLRDILTSIGTTTKATIVFLHSAATATTTYTVSTTYNASSYSNVAYGFENGSLLSVDSGKTLTLPSPENIKSVPTQHIFSGRGTVSFTYGGLVYAEWAGATGDGSTDDASALNKALAWGGELRLLAGKTYKASGANLTMVGNSKLIIPPGTTVNLHTTRLSAIDKTNVYIGGGGRISSTSINTTDSYPANWQLRGVVEFGSTGVSPISGFIVEGIELQGEWTGPHTYPIYGTGLNKTIEVIATDKRRGILLMNATNVQIRNNTIHGMIGEAIINNHAGGVATFPSDNYAQRIEGNYIYTCNHDGISGQQNHIEDAIYRGNIIRNCLQGIEVFAGLVEGNSILDCRIAGISSGGNYIGTVSIKNNLIRNTYGYGITMQDANPSPYSDVGIIGNTIIATALDGIGVGGTKNFAVLSNYLAEIGTITGWKASAGSAAIKAYDSCGVIAGNFARGTNVTEINGLYIAQRNPNVTIGHNVIVGFAYNYADKGGVTVTNGTLEFIHDQLPTYANNAAALAAGLTAGRIYRTADGTIKVVYAP